MTDTNYEQMLCHLVGHGDEDALAELIEIYRHPLTAFVNSILHDYETAEEITIDVFVDLVCRKAVYRGESSLKTFLFSVGRNKALRYLRKNKQSPFVFCDELWNVPTVTESLEDAVEHSLNKQVIHTSLQQLRPAYREVLFLLYYENMTNQQAAEVLHKSAKQVANLSYRAKNALRTILKEKGMTSCDQ